VIGQTLSHYRVTAALGAGGMGEVYRATDTNLGRDVAIKVLPAEVAQDPERLGRFKREAQLLAALNHPNIAAIYGLEEADGKPFLALELVGGEDLKQHLERGPIPVDEALAIAVQVAEALEEAHEKGIVHRDLKPANVKLTPDGKVKVLDFGLAKAYSGDSASGSSADLSQSPTLAHSGTQAGVILGTAAYMSPEQARGKAVDKRADIWSFGVLLWEMLTARPLFAGETVSDTLAAVLRQEIEYGELPEAAPSGVRALLRRCLERDPRQRLRDIGEARIRLAEPPGGALPLAQPPRPGRGLAGPGLVAAIGLVLGLLAGLTSRWIWPEPGSVPLRKYRIPAAQAKGAWNTPAAALSPDGQRIAYVDRGQLWVRELDELTPRRVSSSERADAPFWSPDGGSIGFFDQQALELRSVPLAGGETRTICDLPRSWVENTATWGTTGSIVFGTRSGQLYEVPELGGQPRLRLAPGVSRDVVGFKYPQFLPGGDRLLAVASRAEGEPGVVIVTGEEWTWVPGLEHGLWFVTYSPSGHLLASGPTQDTGVWAVPFSPQSGRAGGEPFRVSETGVYPMASRDGTLMYVTQGLEQLAWVDREGRTIASIGQPQPEISQPAISPDGRQVAVAAVEDGRSDIWVHDSDRGTKWPLTADAPWDSQPAWAPSGETIALTSGRRELDEDGRPEGEEAVLDSPLRGRVSAVYSVPVGGQAEPTPLAVSEQPTFEAEYSPDGRHLVFATVAVEGGNDEEGWDYDIWHLPLSDGGAPAPLIATPASELLPTFAPDGRHLAFMSDRTGRLEIYVTTFPEADRTWGPISTDGGVQPKWSRHGELFYIDQEGLMAVRVDTSSGFSWSPPERVFTQDELGARLVDPSQVPIGVRYDVAADGQRFVVVRSLAGPDSGITVVQNWLAEFGS
jgi:Tol biopolymer transport system component